METSKRRAEIMRILCRRRHETVTNLATEFGVSERTIQRDIDALSVSEPIYTQTGRYGGGVYIMSDYRADRMYMTSDELNVLRKLADFADMGEAAALTEAERATLGAIILQDTKPGA